MYSTSREGGRQVENPHVPKNNFPRLSHVHSVKQAAAPHFSMMKHVIVNKNAHLQ